MNSTIAQVNQPSFAPNFDLVNTSVSTTQSINWLSYILIIFVIIISMIVGIVYWYNLTPDVIPIPSQQTIWCYIGKDAGKRMCIELNKSDQCGTIKTYKSSDECVSPTT